MLSRATFSTSRPRTLGPFHCHSFLTQMAFVLLLFLISAVLRPAFLLLLAPLRGPTERTMYEAWRTISNEFYNLMSQVKTGLLVGSSG